MISKRWVVFVLVVLGDSDECVLVENVVGCVVVVVVVDVVSIGSFLCPVDVLVGAMVVEVVVLVDSNE